MRIDCLKTAPTYYIFSCRVDKILSASWSKHVASNAGKSDKSALCLGEFSNAIESCEIRSPPKS